ncbi:copper/zinc superoxide dismutase [Puccinia triticina 1-1 BBBD Race 1]|uniref:Copper/zinc superoxide dismutase n=2 Tax=Puccinia triticina TaxID=208348 RepID=A0A0C4ETH4_PUCT1|nr:uncharacterized protein PtA15_3A857 [Puccinia triticina]OAV89544.1 copper/zinc superoxide dismutase [Puccinia triticina 1-1 BBBD Race 1]WAQ83486.1 hypothetical protein PtA15_3A857 [Puccinia triticina]
MLGSKNGSSIGMQFMTLLVLASQFGIIAAVPNQPIPQTPAPTSATAQMKDAAGVLKATFLFYHGKDGLTNVAIEYSGVPSKHEFILHIHERAHTPGDCSNAGVVYNPTNVVETKNSHPIGNLSARHGKLLVGYGGKTTPIKFSDSKLKLAPISDGGIIGRTVMIHNSNKDIVACDIIKVKA